MARMADVAALPSPSSATTTRGASILAGYLRAPGAYRAWTPDEWSRARSWPNVGWLVPIYVYRRGQSDPAGAARDAVAQAQELGAPAGSVIVLDVEQGDAPAAHASEFVPAFGEAAAAEHHPVWVYTSLATAYVCSGLAGWLAHWTNTPHIEPHAIATQWASPTSDRTLSVDLSDVADQALGSLWSLRNHEVHPMGSLAAQVVAVVNRPQNDGYWLVAGDGGVFAYGRAPAIGSFGGKHLAAAIVDATSTPSGAGLYLVGADGGVLTLGDAAYHGSIPGSGIGPAPGTPGDPTP